MFFGVLIIAIVYLPILALSGIEGKMFHPMALTVMLALGGSLILALTLMPALCSFLLRGKVAEGDNFIILALKAIYAPTLQLALRLRWLIVLGALESVNGDIDDAQTYWLESWMHREPHAALNLGTSYRRIGETERGIKWLQRAVEVGNAQAAAQQRIRQAPAPAVIAVALLRLSTVPEYSCFIGNYTLRYRGWGTDFEAACLEDNRDGFTVTYRSDKRVVGVLTATANPVA